jgi:aldehyde dehydrogenase family 7 member A1
MISTRLALRRTVANAQRQRLLSTRASNILSALDIPTGTEVPGVYDGTWGGKGDVIESKCPSTGEVLARVQTVCAVSCVR